MDLPPVARDVLDFWFGAPGSPEHGRARAVWFRRDAAFDETIRQRFGEAVNIAIAGGFGDWCATARGALARILVLDQFTRNIYRGTARAFAGDARALATAEDAMSRGFDRELSMSAAGPPQGANCAPAGGSEQRSSASVGAHYYERWFMYMPFEHAEDAQAQQRSLELFGALAADMNDDEPLVWARKHADVVFRFGRYPHRNAILGRASTPEEAAFLREPGSAF